MQTRTVHLAAGQNIRSACSCVAITDAPRGHGSSLHATGHYMPLPPFLRLCSPRIAHKILPPSFLHRDFLPSPCMHTQKLTHPNTTQRRSPKQTPTHHRTAVSPDVGWLETYVSPMHRASTTNVAHADRRQGQGQPSKVKAICIAPFHSICR